MMDAKRAGEIESARVRSGRAAKFHRGRRYNSARFRKCCYYYIHIWVCNDKEISDDHIVIVASSGVYLNRSKISSLHAFLFLQAA